MTAHKSANYVFPDFDPLIDRLKNSRSAIESARDMTLKRSHLSQGDVRVTAFTHLYHAVTFALVSLRVLDGHLLPSQNKWWQDPKQQAVFGIHDEGYRDTTANSFNNAFVKYTVMHKLFRRDRKYVSPVV